MTINLKPGLFVYSFIDNDSDISEFWLKLERVDGDDLYGIRDGDDNQSETEPRTREALLRRALIK